MTNINYTQFSEEKKVEAPVEAEVATTTATELPPVEVTALPPEASVATSGYVEIVEEPENEEPAPPAEENVVIKGVVANCARLNVRKEASTEAVAIKIINRGATVKIVEDDPTEEFYKVLSGGIVGFCMKEFIEIQ